MKKNCICLVAMLLATFSATSVYSQRKAGSENKITSSDLESNVSFPASHPMTGPNSVFVITDNQSKELLDIAMELITRTMYDIGLTVANKKPRIVVDNPYSSWGKSK